MMLASKYRNMIKVSVVPEHWRMLFVISGDRAAAHLVTLLSSNPSLLLLKVTARISPEVMLQLTTLTEQNIKAAKAAKTKKPPKAK